MKLQKVLTLVFSVAFFVACLQGVRVILRERAGSVCNILGPLGTNIPELVLVCGALGILLFFGVQWWKEEATDLRLCYWLFLVGGASNLLERLAYGCVTDYIHMGAFLVFNGADVLLTVGVVGMLWSFWQRRNTVTTNAKAQITNVK